MKRWLWAPLLALSLSSVAWGLHTGGWVTVAGWFGQLCSACIGLSAR
jgi:hypothetical protein